MAKNLRTRLFEWMFEADTRVGKIFDVSLLIAILLSVITVLAESVPVWRVNYKSLFFTLEWSFTIIFTIEYFLRIYAAQNRFRYIFSFFGIIDLLAILPAYISIFLFGAHSLLIIRAFRLLRVFRVLKVSRYSSASATLVQGLKNSKEKIGVFLFSVFTVVLLVGTLIYLIEGEAHGFTSIPKSIYWAVVTITTVGYGDITPQTALGQLFSGILMIMGYAIIAVPTGIISVEMARSVRKTESTQVCPSCMKEGHQTDAIHCKHCGSKLND